MARNEEGVSQFETLAWLDEHVVEAGWNLTSPSPECQAALAVPDQLRDAPYWDQFGIRASLLAAQLLQRYWQGKHTPPEHGRALSLHALYMLAQQELEGRREITREELEAKNERIQRWREDRLLPAARRMREASDEQILRDPASFEPALTHAVLHMLLDIVDQGGSRIAISKGWLMHEEGLLKVKGHLDLAEADLDRVFHWLSEAGQVAFVDDDGKIRVDAMMVKSAADAVMGRTPPLQEAYYQPSVQAIEAAGGAEAGPLDVRDADALAALQAVDAKDTVEFLNGLVGRRLRAVRPGSANEAVLREIVACASSTASREGLVTRVAESSGLAASTVSEALKVELERLKAALRTQGQEI